MQKKESLEHVNQKFKAKNENNKNQINSQNKSGAKSSNSSLINYKILHQDNFMVEKVITESCQASIYIGKVKSYEDIAAKDLPFVQNKQVVIKQYPLKNEKDSFMKELKILKKIKILDLKNNGGFPLIISAKRSNTLGELMMTFVGQDLYKQFDIQKGLEDPKYHKSLDLKTISEIGIQTISQLEILHKLGFVHGDLKFQNICCNQSDNVFSIIDFGLCSKIFNKNGTHKTQEKVSSFYGNSLFASDSMSALMTTSRKDDLESLMYIMCYLLTGTLPVIEFINENIDKFDMDQFLNNILDYRVKNKQHCHDEIVKLLYGSMKSAFQYIISLKHEEKPNYELIKLYMAFDEEYEIKALESKLVTENK